MNKRGLPYAKPKLVSPLPETPSLIAPAMLLLFLLISASAAPADSSTEDRQGSQADVTRPEPTYKMQRLRDWIRLAKDYDPDTAVAGIFTILKFGKEAAPAIPSLEQIMRNEDKPIKTRAAAAYVLWQLGVPVDVVVPQLNALIRTKEAGSFDAANWLGSIGPAAKAHLPALDETIKAISSDEDELTGSRLALVEELERTLRKIDPEREPVVYNPAMLKLLARLVDDDVEVRRKAAKDPLVHQSKTMTAAKSLKDIFLKELDLQVLCMLGNIPWVRDELGEELGKRLIAAVNSPDTDLAKRAAMTLTSAGKAGLPALPALRERLAAIEKDAPKFGTPLKDFASKLESAIWSLEYDANH